MHIYEIVKIVFYWVFDRTKFDSAIADSSAKLVVYNYFKFDPEEHNYGYVVLASYGAPLRGGTCSPEEIDDKILELRETLKPVYHQFYGSNFEVVTIIDNEGPPCEGWLLARQKYLKSLSLKAKLQRWWCLNINPKTASK